MNEYTEPGPLAELLELLRSMVPVGITGALVVIALVGAHKLLARTATRASDHAVRNQLIMLGLSFVGLLAIVITLPVGDETQRDIIHLVGLLLSAALALSSTTLLGNALAGLMLRAVRNFRVGDFIRVGEHFGRVSERGLFHTEIQTEDRDLTTLPNLFLITNAVRVTRSTGTVVSATLSLGYDVPRKQIEDRLVLAADRVGLEEPFVQVTELGDFSVTYRVGGVLREVKRIVAFRSGLRKAAMDALHEAGIEIVSPTFMNTRERKPSESVVPTQSAPSHGPMDREARAELLFDKAEEATALEDRRARLDSLDVHIAEVKKEIAAASESGSERESMLAARMTRLSARRDALEREVEARADLMRDLDDG